MKFRIKGTFTDGRDKEFVRYWRNSRGVAGWIFPEVKDQADAFTAKQCAAFTAKLSYNPPGRYSFEPVDR